MPRGLPTYSARYVGRRAALTDLSARLAGRSRVVAVTGTAGVGKTRLACEAARATGRQALFVDLASARTSSDVGQAVVRDLGRSDVEPEQVGAALSDAGVELVLLDDAEGVADRLGESLASWRADAPGVTWCITSRVAPGGFDAEVVRLEPFGPDERDDAVSLFQRSMPRLGPAAFDPQRDADRLAAIVDRLDGLPLAIELAAGRAAVLTLEEIERGLDAPLRLLRDPSRRSGRISALEDSVRASFDLLEPDLAAAAAALSVFEGGFDLAGAAAVIGPTGDAADVLQALMGRHLVVRDPERRFGMYASVKVFAAAWAAERAIHIAAWERHAAWCSDRVRKHDPGLAAGWRQVARDAPNFAAVVTRAVGPYGTPSLRAAARTVVTRGFPLLRSTGSTEELLSAIDRLLDDAAPHQEQAALWRVRAMTLRTLVRHPEALEAARTAARLGRETSDPNLGGSLAIAAEMELALGRVDEARRVLEAAIEAARGVHPTAELQARVMLAGRFLLREGRADQALAHLEAAAALRDDHLGSDARGQALSALATARLRTGDYAGARRLFAEAEGTWGGLIRPPQRAGLRMYEGVLALAERGAAALPEVRASALAVDGMGIVVYAAFAWAHLAAGAAAAGRPDPDAVARARGWLGRVVARRDRELIGATLAAGLLVSGESAELPDMGLARDSEHREVVAGVGLIARLVAGEADVEAARPIPSRLAAGGEYGRVVASCLAAAIARADERAARWTVAPDGAWFATAGSTERRREARPTLRRLLARLARARVHGEAGLDAAALFEAGWPGERATAAAAANRVRVAVTQLRKAGVTCLAWDRGRGWYLDAPVRWGPHD